MAEVQHEMVWFSGRVQGVGFRFTTLQLAREFEVAGYVRNLADGRVEVSMEGAAGEIEAFIEAIQNRLHGNIRQTERQSGRRAPRHRGFEIR